jgi:hypothetical protein
MYSAQRLAFAEHGAGAGVDSAWEQKKLEAKKTPENAAESLASSAPWNDGERSFSAKETVQQKYTPNEQVHKPYKAVETRIVSQSRGAPWLPVE